MTIRKSGSPPVARLWGHGILNHVTLGLDFLVVAIIAAALGFGGIAGTAASIAKVLFYIFVAIFLITLLASIFAGRKL